MNCEADEPHAPSHIQRLLMFLVTTACRYPKPVLGTALVACILSIYASSTRLEYRTERSDLVSPRKDYQQRWRKYLAEFGEDDDIVVVVKGADRNRWLSALDDLAAEFPRTSRAFRPPLLQGRPPAASQSSAFVLAGQPRFTKSRKI